MRKKTKKGILIIGGGILQIYSLKKASEMGFTTYLTDGSEMCVAKCYADHFYKIDTRNINKQAELAYKLKKEGKIIAVYTQGTDIEYTVAYAAKKASLPGISPQVAFNCNNKLKMREILKKHKISDTPFVSVKSTSEFNQIINKIDFPVYIKPVDNCASRGITRVTNPKQLKTSFEKAIQHSHHVKEVLIEAEMRGTEHSVDTILYKGKMFPAGISDRIFLKKERYAVQAGSRTPSLLQSDTQEKIYETMEKAAHALGVRQGAFKGDIIVEQGNKINIIEITARTSGGFDSQVRKPLSFGVDLIKATIDIACGYKLDPIDLIPKWMKWSSTISLFPKPGRVVSIKGVNKLKKMRGIHEVIILTKNGDIIEPYEHCAHRTNYIISHADTFNQLLDIESKIRSTLVIKTTT